MVLGFAEDRNLLCLSVFSPSLKGNKNFLLVLSKNNSDSLGKGLAYPVHVPIPQNKRILLSFGVVDVFKS